MTVVVRAASVRAHWCSPPLALHTPIRSWESLDTVDQINIRPIFLFFRPTRAPPPNEVRAAGVGDPTRFVVKLALRVIGDRYSDEVLRLILNLDGNGKH